MTGQEVTLRELAPGDAPAIQAVYTPHAVRWLPRGPMLDATEAQQWTAHALALRHQDPWARVTFSIVLGDGVLGMVRLDRRGPQEAALSCILRPDCWGRGIGRRAVEQCLAEAFTTHGLKRVSARHYKANEASARMLTAAGFAPLDISVHHVHYTALRGWWQAATDPWAALLPGGPW